MKNVSKIMCFYWSYIIQYKLLHRVNLSIFILLIILERIIGKLKLLIQKIRHKVGLIRVTEKKHCQKVSNNKYQIEF